MCALRRQLLAHRRQCGVGLIGERPPGLRQVRPSPAALAADRRTRETHQIDRAELPDERLGHRDDDARLAVRRADKGHNALADLLENGLCHTLELARGNLAQIARDKSYPADALR